LHDIAEARSNQLETQHFVQSPLMAPSMISVVEKKKKRRRRGEGAGPSASIIVYTWFFML
jgi:hypothetical protein